MTEKALLLHARLNAFQRLVDRTRDVIREGLSQCERPYVACSFGKDSSVMLHLVLEKRPDMPVRWVTFPETRMIGSYDAVVSAWKDRHPSLRLEEVFVDVGVSDEYDDRKALEGKGYDAFFVGIRAEESVGRRITLRKDGQIYRRADGVLRIAPLAWWTTRDVAAYLVTHDLPILDTYAADGFYARTTTGLPDDRYSMRAQMLASLKRRDPAAFNALLKRFPEAAFYV